jgi:hypothetical protein
MILASSLNFVCHGCNYCVSQELANVRKVPMVVSLVENHVDTEELEGILSFLIWKEVLVILRPKSLF